MLRTTFTGDQEFIEEAKPGFVVQDPGLVNLAKLMSSQPSDQLYASFHDYLARLIALTNPFATEAKYALLGLEHKVIDDAFLLLAQAELPKEKQLSTTPKPVEVYRRFASVLRQIGMTSRVWGMDAIRTLREIYLAQTQPDGELETPFWTDGMTGETDPEFATTAQDIPDKHVLSPEGGVLAAVTEMLATVEETARFKKPIVVSEWQTWCVRRSKELQEELSWDDKTRWEWVEAQGAASGSGEIEELDDPLDDRGYVPPTLTKDLISEGDDRTIDTSCFFPLSETMRAFNQARKHIFAQMAKDEIPGPKWKPTFQTRLRETDEFTQMVSAIQQTADNYGAKEAVAVYLRVAGDYGLLSGKDDVAIDYIGRNYDDVSGIILDPHKSIASITSFGEFLAEYENDISELMTDGSFTVRETEESMVDDFVAETKNIISKRYPSNDHNALNTSSWNIAYQNAIASGASFPDAEAKAWETWRYSMSFFAAKEYDRVMKIERNRTKAMAAFWRFAPPSVPRPQDAIVSVNKDGLNLKKRSVTWGIAKLKLTKDELQLNPETALRLHDILKSKGWGADFARELHSRFIAKK